MSSSSRGPSGGGRRDARDDAPRSNDDSQRGGFGGPRWGEYSEPARPIRSDEPMLQERGFGQSGWNRDIPDDERDDDLGDDESEAPRRRKPPVPPPYPRKTLAALGGTVRVTRDDLGIPHIAAKSERDALVALGYCMAEDRLWQLDVVRRLALGRSAELFGAVFARHDAVVRTAGVPRRAAAAATSVSGGARDALAAFTAGVNAARAEARPAECEVLGYEIEPWTVADSLAIELLLALAPALGVFADKLLVARAIAHNGIDRARWISSTPLDLASAGGERAALWRQLDTRVLDLLADLPFECWLTGNAFAAPREGGAGAVLAAALHGPPALPPPTYVAHLEAPGFSVAGVAHVGMPAFQLGRNRASAWAGVAASVDDADCVLEELDGIGNFRTEAGWTRLHTRREQVRVRDGENLQFEVLESRNGPLLSHLAQQLDGAPPDPRAPGIALRWGANSLGSATGGWVAMARAKSLRDVSAAAALGRGPLAMHVIAADAQGRVGRFATGAIPVRDDLARLPVRGWCGEGAWTAVQPIGAPAKASPSPRVAVAATRGRDSAEGGAAGATERRVRERLPEAGATIEACRAVHGDRVDPLAQALLPLVRAALAEAAGDDELLRDAALALEGWDGTASAESRPAALWYAALLHFLPRELFPESRFGPLVRFPQLCFASLSRILLAETSPWFADAKGRERALAAAFARAAAWQREAAEPRTWAAAAPLATRHPLAQDERFAAGAPAISSPGGSPFSIGALDLRAGALPFVIALAPSARVAVDLTTDELAFALAGGESGVVGNAHFVDQLDAFSAGEARVVRLGPDARGDLTELIAG